VCTEGRREHQYATHLSLYILLFASFLAKHLVAGGSPSGLTIVANLVRDKIKLILSRSFRLLLHLRYCNFIELRDIDFKTAETRLIFI